MVTWKVETDYLRCSPNFYNKPRFDYVLVQTENKPVFAQLIFIFSVTIGQIKYPLALVQMFDAPTSQTQKDKDAGLFAFLHSLGKCLKYFLLDHSSGVHFW